MQLLSYFLSKQTKNYGKITNWNNVALSENLFYSFRDTCYNESNYPSTLHYHDYYELVVFVEGDIEYLCDENVYPVKKGDVIIIPPRSFHLSRLINKSTEYKRHVFYFFGEQIDKELFCLFAKKAKKGEIYNSEKILSLATDIKEQIKENCPVKKALCNALFTQIICTILSDESMKDGKSQTLPEKLNQIKSFIDNNYGQINSVSAVANEFYYSREYLSRLFKKYFNTTVNEYINKLRVVESQKLLSKGESVTDACYRVGFGSLSTYIRVFNSVTGMTPLEYKKAVGIK